MDEPEETENSGDASEVALDGEVAEAILLKPGSQEHLAQIESEISSLTALGKTELHALLHEIIEGIRTIRAETIVRVCRRAHQENDRRTLNLAFEALTKTVAPLLLSQAKGLTPDERQEQVQDIHLQLFSAIRSGKSELAERFFASYARRRSIDLYRKRQTRMEGAFERQEPADDADPVDQLPDKSPAHDARFWLSEAIRNLPPKHRSALIQRYYLGREVEEIAAHHHVDVRTVRRWLKKAKTAMGLQGEEHE